jgi:predicted RNase H-like HicB family nuclease
MIKKNLHYVIWKEGKYFVVRSLEVEVASQGKTRAEAIENLKEALALYFEDQNIKTPSIKNPSLESLPLSFNA